MLSLVILFLAAHAYGDFLLQGATIAKQKHRFPLLLAHVLIHGVLVYALLQQWTAWQPAVAILLLHAVIDAVKARRPLTARAFAWDQVAHVASVVLVAWLSLRLGWCRPFDGVGWTWIVGGAGFVAAVIGSGYYVGAVTDSIISRNPGLADSLKPGLVDGGKQIGRLERAFIFILIAASEPSGIGFLIAAKSILRFEEAKQQPVAEYVIIGTLWSFGLALVLAWLTVRAIGLAPLAL
jgi:hypothetical protein